MGDDGKIYHYQAEKIVGITVPNASKINLQNKLLKNIGHAKSAMYLRENFSSKTDYLQIKEELFSNKGAEEIYNDILTWKKNQR